MDPAEIQRRTEDLRVVDEALAVIGLHRQGTHDKLWIPYGPRDGSYVSATVSVVSSTPQVNLFCPPDKKGMDDLRRKFEESGLAVVIEGPVHRYC